MYVGVCCFKHVLFFLYSTGDKCVLNFKPCGLFGKELHRVEGHIQDKKWVIKASWPLFLSTVAFLWCWHRDHSWWDRKAAGNADCNPLLFTVLNPLTLGWSFEAVVEKSLQCSVWKEKYPGKTQSRFSWCHCCTVFSLKWGEHGYQKFWIKPKPVLWLWVSLL